MTDFFISFAQGDRSWAYWITWTLEDAGYRVYISERPFTVAGDFHIGQEALISNSKRMILILSQAYLESKFTEAEWTGAFAKDPTGKEGKLVAVRVEPVELQGLLTKIISIDLVGKNEQDAREALLAGIGRGRVKPGLQPSFPHERKPLSYPGTAASADPAELLPFINEFRRRHSEPRKNAFIMMRFGEGRRHQAIEDAIKRSLVLHDITALRADDNTYSEYLMENLRTYMHGCGFGVAVFERIESEAHNPNVALEVGYMLALGKRVCLLKDKTLRELPTDIMGSLYSEFDLDDVDTSIQSALTRWLKQRGLAKE